MTYLGAFALLILGISRLTAMLEMCAFSLTTALLAAQSLLAGALLLMRRESSMKTHWWVDSMAWASAALPLAMVTPSTTTARGLFPVPGLVLILWALISLGRAFGISPAHRGLVMSGPYRFLRHPMYAGELLSLAGVLTAFPGLQNMLVFIIFFTSILWRIQQEEKLLGRNGYRHYAEHVKWRLVPGVW